MPYSWRGSITAHMLIVSPVSRTWAFVGSLPMCGVLPPIHSSFCGHYGGSCFDISSLQPYSEHEVYNPMVESMFYSSFLCRLLVFLSIGWILNRMKDNRELYTHGRLYSFICKQRWTLSYYVNSWSSQSSEPDLTNCYCNQGLTVYGLKTFFSICTIGWIVPSKHIYGALIFQQVHFMDHWRSGQISRPKCISIQHSSYSHPFFLEQGEDLWFVTYFISFTIKPFQLY